MKVFLSDESLLVRRRLEELLAELPTVELIDSWDKSTDLLHAILMTRPDVLILDVELLHGRGIEILSALQASGMDMLKIVLTTFPNPLFRQLCLKGGADYFLDKTIEFENIVEILERMDSRMDEGT